MLRKVLFQCHWFVGITVGAILAFSGLTGGLMAFGPQLTDYFSGGYQSIDGHGAPPLGTGELYARVQAALPERTITELTTYADATRPARVRLAVAAGFIGPTAPIAETRMVDPYSGALLPVRPFGQAVERGVHWLHDVHQGHWGGPADPVARSGGFLVGLGSVLLLFVALSGLYIRWPAGRSARSWRAWLALYPRLKGRAFLFNLHAVFGTVALLFLLVSAHSGAFQNGEMNWYGNGVRALVGLPAMRRPGGPPGAGGPPPTGAMGPGGMGPGGPARPGGPEGPRDPNTVRLIHLDVDDYFDADGLAHGAKQSTLDRRSGAITPQPPEPAARSFGEKLAATNQILHEGRILGTTGTLLMMLASLCLPAFFVTGWMMYLKRR